MLDITAPTTEKTTNVPAINELVLEQINSQIANQLNTGVLVLDADFNIVLWNRFLQVHTDKISDNIIGQSIFSAFPELPQRWLTRKLSSVLQLNTPSFALGSKDTIYSNYPILDLSRLIVNLWHKIVPFCPLKRMLQTNIFVF